MRIEIELMAHKDLEALYKNNSQKSIANNGLYLQPGIANRNSPAIYLKEQAFLRGAKKRG
jgi:hypothetical protein